MKKSRFGICVGWRRYKQAPNLREVRQLKIDSNRSQPKTTLLSAVVSLDEETHLATTILTNQSCHGLFGKKEKRKSLSRLNNRIVHMPFSATSCLQLVRLAICMLTSTKALHCLAFDSAICRHHLRCLASISPCASTLERCISSSNLFQSNPLHKYRSPVAPDSNATVELAQWRRRPHRSEFYGLPQPQPPSAPPLPSGVTVMRQAKTRAADTWAAKWATRYSQLKKRCVCVYGLALKFELAALSAPEVVPLHWRRWQPSRARPRRAKLSIRPGSSYPLGLCTRVRTTVCQSVCQRCLSVRADKCPLPCSMGVQAASAWTAEPGSIDVHARRGQARRLTLARRQHASSFSSALPAHSTPLYALLGYHRA
ncbi:unnamed protein product [Protopolystoma xenopodis]|uniref:Uncharacterized protein n=1 Tax=Protopolystoma xenopodis TaxID=117903 RepID=A0A448X0Z9_9PLAT|nr:unnamed protein product [Protopolystoma xenopodis]